MIEPHLHGELVTLEPVHGIQNMATAGVEAAILLSSYMVGPNTTCEELGNYHEYMYTFYRDELESNGIQPFFGFGVPAVGMNAKEAERSYSRIEEYLKKPETVCVGEVGIHFSTESEIEKFERQIEIADELNMPLNTHTPIPRAERKPEIVDKTLNIVEEKGFDPSKVVIGHISPGTIDTVLERGAWADISCCADKLNAREAAKIAQEHKDDNIIVTSEFGWGVRGHYSVPRVAYEMKLLGMSREEIEKVIFENPVQLFNLDLEF